MIFINNIVFLYFTSFIGLVPDMSLHDLSGPSKALELKIIIKTISQLFAIYF
jgi:hypothetical protein